MSSTKEACVLCAWRENCQKKFSLSGKDIRCPDFVRDLNIKEKKPAENQGEQEKEVK